MNSQKSITHLSRDPIMKKLIRKHQLPKIGEPANLFLELVNIITGQQLSVHVGQTIYNRLLSLLNTVVPEQVQPKHFLTLSLAQLRSVGLSAQKANYLHHLSRAVENNHIILDHLKNLSDDEVFHEITKLKGLGPWSAEMFLMFSLLRPDIFSVNDLGLRTAINKLYEIDREDKTAILELSNNWSPYRTLASRYLWASLKNT